MPHRVTNHLRDPSRLAAVAATALLDTPPEAAFDGLVALAVRCTGAPTAYMSLVTADRQFFKSAYRLPPALTGLRETPLSHSICQWVVEYDAPLIIADARTHPLTQDNGAVREHGVVAYAGVPLRDEQGQVLGAICAVDVSPRAWHIDAIVALERIATAVATEIKLRRQLAERERAEAEVRASAARTEASEARFRAFVEQASDAIVVLDRQARISYVSPASERVLGYDADAITGSSVLELLLPDDVGSVLKALMSAVERPGSVYTIRTRARHADGGWRTVEAAGRLLEGVEDQYSGILVHVRDVSDYVAAVDALQKSEERFRALSAAAPIAVLERDAAGAVTYANARAEELWQLPAEALMGTGWLARVHPDDRSRVAAGGATLGREAREHEDEYRLLLPNGDIRWLHGRTAPIWDNHVDLAGSVSTLHDVTARRDAMERLTASEARLRLALRAARMAAWEVDVRDWMRAPADRDGLLVRISDEGGQVVQTVGAFLATVHPDDRGRVEEAATRAIVDAVDFEEEFRVWNRAGELRFQRVKGRPIPDAAGSPSRMIGVMLDVTPQKLLEAELRHRLHHDALTGLANRVLFRERLIDDLARATRVGTPSPPLAVLFLDIDDFKRVNDSLGHDAGDQLLVMVANRLRQATLDGDIVARLGGDEFAILLHDLRHPTDATVVADRVAACLSVPFEVGTHRIGVSVSTGIAFAQPHDRPEDVLRDADVAMYHAKRQGKGHHSIFEPAMHAAAVERLELEADLRRALAQDELLLQFQPIMDVESRTVRGAEALVRWQHPDRGLLSPAAFIPLAEATELIVPLGGWVLREACRIAAGWSAAADPATRALTIAVNVSGRQLASSSFHDQVTDALRCSGLAADRLVLEVTESMLIEGSSTMLEQLEALRALGVRLAVDDFGTGYSSLAQLEHLPVDVIKIDRSFVAGITEHRRRAALTRAIVNIADSLGLQTVAEGVETEEQHAALRALCCSSSQGYLYARPLGVAAFERFCRGEQADEMEPVRQ